MVRMIGLRFKIQQKGAMPQWINLVPPKKADKEQSSGSQRVNREEAFSSPVCGLAGFGLLTAGFELVGANSTVLHDRGKTYRILQFWFVAAQFVDGERSLEFEKNKSAILAGIDEFRYQSWWRVQAFVNPFFGKGGEAVEDHFTISINLDGRQPAVNDDGSPRTRQMRDGLGIPTGEVVLMEPPERLVFDDDDNLTVV